MLKQKMSLCRAYVVLEDISARRAAIVPPPAERARSYNLAPGILLTVHLTWRQQHCCNTYKKWTANLYSNVLLEYSLNVEERKQVKACLYFLHKYCHKVYLKIGMRLRLCMHICICRYNYIDDANCFTIVEQRLFHHKHQND